jgi:biotin transporter BioY
MTRAAVRRMLYAIFGIGLVLVVGTVGFHLIAGLSAVDSFYYESMLATGQGPPSALPTDGDKIFTSIMAFISVGSVVSTLLFAVGPVLRQFWREEVEYLEAGARAVEREIERHM